MSYPTSVLAICVFLLFVGVTLGLSFLMGRRAKDSSGYFAAHGQIPWFINGVAFAGDYLSAASFLGICGMIAFYGYDGFLYSIGYLAGWIVALFVIAEPMKRRGKFTFADALNSTFNSRGIQLVAGISTLAVSLFYLIPQMVGAGVLVRPLLGLPHWAGVVMVGTVVILIVVTAGMVSTTWVQFIKGSLLVVFSTVLTILILVRGLEVRSGGEDGYVFRSIPVSKSELTDFSSSNGTIRDGTTPDETRSDSSKSAWVDLDRVKLDQDLQRLGYRRVVDRVPLDWESQGFYLIEKADGSGAWIGKVSESVDGLLLMECQTQERIDGKIIFNRLNSEESVLRPTGFVRKLPDDQTSTGPIGPWKFLQVISDSEVVLWRKRELKDTDGNAITVFYPQPTLGNRVLSPGEHPTFAGIKQENTWAKLNFISLMFALFCGTASLPHILIRYYTVKDGVAARKSTIIGIATIGFFYVLTLYMGLGAMTSGSLDVTNENMSAPLLARGTSEWLFAIISAIAFTTVLGTVSGLILASAGAVSHDLLKCAFALDISDSGQVRVARMASVVIGVIAIVLGILFEQMNVSYLVGWAFSVAASANLPALVMLLFWKRTTKQGIIAAVLVGMVTSLSWILLSSDTFAQVYQVARPDWIANWVPFSQPGIVTIPLSFVTLIVVSLATQPAKQLESI